MAAWNGEEGVLRAIEAEIMVPLVSSEEIDPLVEAGATEFYCGLGSEELLDRYTNLFPLNAREMAGASVKGVDELRRIADRLRTLDRPLWIAFNLPVPAAQRADWWKAVDRAVDAGVHGVILGSPADLAAVARRHPDLALDVSCLGGAFNEEALAFWADLGARRITLPRQLRLAEIRALARGASSVEICVFAASTNCYFSNAFCATRHGLGEVRHPFLATAARAAEAVLAGPLRPLSSTVGAWKDAVERRFLRREGPLCFRRYEARHVDGRRAEDLCFYDDLRRHAWACSLCALPELLEAGVRSFKVTSRDHPLRRRRIHTRMVAEGLAIARRPMEATERERAMRLLFRRERGCDCEGRFCYYGR